MKYTLTEATNGGWAVHKRSDSISKKKLVAVGPNLAEACAMLTATAKGVSTPRHYTLAEYAKMIVDVDTYGNSPRKINMIKLLRAITNCGLKEAKDAIEEAL